jgi:hypothetical protein
MFCYTQAKKPYQEPPKSLRQLKKNLLMLHTSGETLPRAPKKSQTTQLKDRLH